MVAFSSKAHSLWNETFDFSEISDDADIVVRIKNDIGSRHPIIKLHRCDNRVFIIMTSEFSKKLSVSAKSTLSEIETALSQNGMKWYGEDALYYLSDEKEINLKNDSDPEGVRQLSEIDMSLFQDFQSRNTEKDLDDVEVELDNDAVFGFIDNETLNCVADYYRWSNKDVADIGVLTAPDSRGKGAATTVVAALCRHALSDGLLPQYRCQLDNHGSIGVAEKIGFKRYGLWTVGVPVEN
jgi:RimJ/RimL family protein N-acetyltransferase